jgi:cupin superfamily acireductone dioxygenase involved in methionine salvage
MSDIKNKEMFSAMRDIFFGGEFAHWLDKQENIPYAALREFQEAEEYFCAQTGFDIDAAYKEYDELQEKWDNHPKRMKNQTKGENK